MWELDYKEGRVLKNWCFWTVVVEKTLESPVDSKEIKPVNPKKKSVLNIHWKNWCWSWNSNTLATWCEELSPWKRPWCWERLKAGGERDDRGWDVWMASSTWWTSLSKLREILKDSEGWHATVHVVMESDTTEWLNNNKYIKYKNKWHSLCPQEIWNLVVVKIEKTKIKLI